MDGQSNIGTVVSTIFSLVIAVYVVYAMIKAFVDADPSFGTYGWPILGALVIGVIAYFRSLGNR